MLEIEMKFPVADFAPILERMTLLHAKGGEPVEEADHYFNAPDRDFARTDEALRLRRVGSRSLVTYKGPKEPGPTKTRTELELPLTPGAESAERFCRFLAYLGYRATAVVKKIRRAFHFRGDGFSLKVCLDEVESLGHFVEVEIVATESDKEKAQRVILKLAEEMGLDNAERLSYLEMVLEKMKRG
ncbi:MAG: class IV adenylate cyclase [Gemmataceae bacterium]|nr:class IV adenylate cyclase [Gemmataceae bacterium]